MIFIMCGVFWRQRLYLIYFCILSWLSSARHSPCEHEADCIKNKAEIGAISSWRLFPMSCYVQWLITVKNCFSYWFILFHLGTWPQVWGHEAFHFGLITFFLTSIQIANVGSNWFFWCTTLIEDKCLIHKSSQM